jgi:hypothetical protein
VLRKRYGEKSIVPTVKWWFGAICWLMHSKTTWNIMFNCQIYYMNYIYCSYIKCSNSWSSSFWTWKSNQLRNWIEIGRTLLKWVDTVEKIGRCSRWKNNKTD